MTAFIDATQAMQLPAVWVLPISMLIPVIVAAATHPGASSATRQGLALFAALAVALLDQIVSDSFTIEGLLVAASVAFITQLGTYLGTNRVVDYNKTVLPTRGIGA